MRNPIRVSPPARWLPDDSGGPVTLRGPDGGVGLVVTTGVPTGRGLDLGTPGITRLPPQVGPEDVIHERLRLITAAGR
jgi:hypothetical protein